MKKNAFSIYFFAAFSFLIPIPARFAFGIACLLELNFLLFMSFAFDLVLTKLNLENARTISHFIFILALTALYSVFLQEVAPLVAFSMQFSIYLVAFSSLALGTFVESEEPAKQKLKSLLALILPFDFFAAVFFAIRDIFGFGTLTFFNSNGIFEISVFGENWTGFRFFAAIPFSALLVALFATLNVFVLRKIKILNQGAGF